MFRGVWGAFGSRLNVLRGRGARVIPGASLVVPGVFRRRSVVFGGCSGRGGVPRAFQFRFFHAMKGGCSGGHTRAEVDEAVDE